MDEDQTGKQMNGADELSVPRYEAANALADDRNFDDLSGPQAYEGFARRVVKA